MLLVLGGGRCRLEGWLSRALPRGVVATHEVVHTRLECLLVESYLFHVPILSREHKFSLLQSLSLAARVRPLHPIFLEFFDSITISERVQGMLTA